MDVTKLCADLKRLKEESGNPSLTVLAGRLHLSKSRISEILNGQTTSLDWDFVKAFVSACHDHATATGRHPGTSTDLNFWRNAHASTEFARPAEPRVTGWSEAVEKHPIWTLVNGDTSSAREDAVELASQLAERAHTARRRLKGDPWLDRTLAARVGERVAGLCVLADLTLPPLEAAFLTLAPLVHEAQWSRSAAALTHLRPTDLSQTGESDRAEYERFLRGQQERRLVARAAQHGLTDREEASTEIAWWLYHRWLASRAASTESVLLGLPSPRQHDTLDRLVRLLKLSPTDLRDPQRLELRPVHPHHGLTAHAQEVRERLVGLIFVVAHSLAIELSTLPPTIVEHLGIPEPVRLDELRESLDAAEWSPIPVGVGLRARCCHEAVLEALREHVARTDEVLGAVHSVAMNDNTLEPLRALPARASADEVGPSVGADGKPAFVVPVVRFRLDEGRIRELLMGEQLYRDRSLAIRELYQNALDACRYRKARNDYIHTTQGMVADWQGRIEFDQGVDPVSGRHYLRCTDNGVGMGVAELRDVFSQAGVRFADRPEFLEEQAQWREHGIPFHPNSRFGIGVMSYFMLADEIEVTTCRMDRRGGPAGPVLRINIVGPGHLFRINEIDRDRPTPGTEVKLYLRDGAAAPSCVETLWRLLGIAEFATHARHHDAAREWKPFVYESRQSTSFGEIEDSLDAGGVLVHGAPTVNGQVVWCERGGGLLADGLFVQAGERAAGFSRDDGEDDLTGAIVNLTGSALPALTVNRSHLLGLDWAVLETLLVEALPQSLEAAELLLSAGWICDVASRSPRVADLIVALSNEKGLRISWRGEDGAVGCLAADETLYAKRIQVPRVLGHPSMLLWRLMAHGRTASLYDEIPPTLEAELLPALPSDETLLEECLSNFDELDVFRPGDLLPVAEEVGMDQRALASRLVALGARGVDPDNYPPRQPNADELRVLNANLKDHGSNLDVRVPVTAWHVLAAARRLDKAVEEVLDLLRSYGFDITRATALVAQVEDDDLVAVSIRNDGTSPWLKPDQPVAIGHVVATARTLGREAGEVEHRLAALGFEVPEIPPWAWSADLSLLRGGSSQDSWLSRGDVLRSEVLDQAMSDWGCGVVDAIARYADIGVIALETPELALYSGLLPAECFQSGAPVSMKQLIEIAELFEENPWSLAAEMRDLGFHLPAHYFAGDDYDKLDRGLLFADDEDLEFEQIELSDSVSLETLLTISSRRLCSPQEAAARLGRMGFVVPDLSAWPAAITIVDFKAMSLDGNGVAPWLALGQEVSLGHILLVSEKTGVEPRETAARLSALGFAVPDRAEVPARFAKREVALLLDRRESFIRPTRPVTMRNLILTSLRVRRPLVEVAEGLAALGVEVPDVDVELPKLLAMVPRKSGIPTAE
ncbi:hypothetical protein JNUCC0626_20850 [Lentzea sp. JNUCC 0626]|uniref:wHTH domain-containing protein n=1 Tax=Lentzea sp. JNUCC 0626 TaxID=3367513 RepID=UPI0037481DA1